ncbi:hypothetical protein HN51_046582 [Arachis hypogaea]|uniref:uncharacterized protein LOC107626758 n=1 Tax=Arachis ipaensis TaxID=130454 RepID=UPI000A2B2E4A|nr:uncharacterized protein LOC107626758 [Arachis ipaensis]XP_025631989.1 uncharacterized protein LOC112726705 [Arachis hypogaea]QHO22782.1 uncharacterized protein DS421_12g358120 [Arachis hypogaea]
MGPDLDLKKSGSIHSPAFSRQKVPEPRTDYIGDACGMETSAIEQIHFSSENENVEVNITGQKKVPEPRVDYIGDGCAMVPSRIEQTHFSNENENVEVNITGSTNSGQALVVEDSREDATESSSSFGHTESDTENVPSFSDPEVESCLCADNASSSMSNDYFESPPRRKKGVTSHWRKFIHPLMWRCKWIELRLKQLQSQELKYEKELEAYNYRKQLDFAHLTLDGSDIKSVPISGRRHRNKIMKRKKRNRVEEKYDLASYMSNHSLFSYYEQKDRTVDTCLKDVHGAANGGNIDDIEFKLDDLWSYVDYENSDKSLDDIIQKIEAVQSQVHKLKTRIDKVIKENSGKFDSGTQLDKPGTPQHEPGYQTVDPLIPGNASLTDEGFNLLVEMTDKPRIEDLREEIKDGTLIQNQEAKKELQVSESDFSVEDVVPNIHSTLKVCSTSKSNVPKNKRKRRNKSASWNRM